MDKKDIKILEDFKNDKMQRDKLELNTTSGGLKIGHYYKKFELDQAIEHILSDYKRVLKENEELKEYIALAQNLDEMTATKYINIQQNAYIQGRAEEQQKYFDLINIIKNKIAEFDYEYKKAKRKNDEGRADYYWNLFKHFNRILESE